MIEVLPASASRDVAEGLPFSRCTFSVIIPLEFHRGQARRCVEGWTREQTYPRELFEIVLVAPQELPGTELEALRALLDESDTLLIRPERHDMGLCVAGAEAATKDVLFFTESHVWPEPDVLEKAAEALGKHPAWAGMSLRSVRVTHNQLSVAEADMYEADIEQAMLHHPWRKILDQCFVVRRDAYVRAGGFEAQFGHYAEWLLAARMHLLKLQIGYLPEARVHHFYIGEMHALKEFTKDFAEGEMRFMGGDPPAALQELMPPVPEWRDRSRRRPDCAARMARLLWRHLRWCLRDRTRAPGVWATLVMLAKWGGAWLGGVHAAWFRVRARALLKGWSMRWKILAKRPALHLTDLARYCDALVRARRMDVLRRWHRLEADAVPMTPVPPDASAGEWEPCRDSGTALGFPDIEEHALGRFAWSQPAALVALSLAPGRYKITIECLPVRPPNQPHGARLYFNEKPVLDKRVKYRPHRITAKVRVGADCACRVSWVSRPLAAPGDPRALGLPVHRILWQRLQDKDASS